MLGFRDFRKIISFAIILLKQSNLPAAYLMFVKSSDDNTFFRIVLTQFVHFFDRRFFACVNVRKYSKEHLFQRKEARITPFLDASLGQ